MRSRRGVSRTPWARGRPGVPAACYGVGKVILVDVRTETEVDFQGGPAKVDTIVLKNGTEIVPDMGKAILTQDGKFLNYTVNGKKKNLKVDKVKEVLTSLIGKVAPCSTYTPGANPGRASSSRTSPVSARPWRKSQKTREVERLWRSRCATRAVAAPSARWPSSARKPKICTRCGMRSTGRATSTSRLRSLGIQPCRGWRSASRDSHGGSRGLLGQRLWW